MVFAIRRLILRSRIPNCNSTYRSTPLHLTKASISTSPRIWQQRSFSALSRYNQESDDKSGKKGGKKRRSPKKAKDEVEGDKQPALQQTDVEVDARVAGTDTVQAYEAAASEVTTKENVADQIMNEDTLQEAVSTDSPNKDSSAGTPTQSTLSDETKVSIEVQPEEETRGNILDQVVHETTLQDATSAEPSHPSVDTTSEIVSEVPRIEDEDEPLNQLTTQDDAEINKWKREIGLSDEELAYYVDTYPGIDAELITAVKQGHITEKDLIESMEEDVAEQEDDLTPEQRAEFAKLKPSIEVVGQSLHGEGEEEGFSEEEMKQLGLTKEDIEALASEDPDNIDAARMERLQKAMLKLGLSAEEINSLTDAEADGQIDDGTDMQKLMGSFGGEDGGMTASGSFNGMGLNNNANPRKRLTADDAAQSVGNVSDEDLQQFLDDFGTEQFTPEMRDLFKKAMKGDQTALEQMLSGLSETERKELEDMSESGEAQEKLRKLFDPEAETVDHSTIEEQIKKLEAEYEALGQGDQRNFTDQMKEMTAEDDEDPDIAAEIRKIKAQYKAENPEDYEEPEVYKPREEDFIEDERHDRGPAEMDANDEAELEAARAQIRADPEYQKMLAGVANEANPMFDGGSEFESLRKEDPDFDDFMKMLDKDGIDPAKMNEAEFMKALEAKLEQPVFTETAEGDVIRVHNVGSKEELANVRSGITQSGLMDGPSGMEGMQIGPGKQNKTKYEALIEREGVPRRAAGESAEDFELRKLGLLDKEGLEDARKEKEEPGFWNYGQENEDVGEDEEFQGDDLPSAGHAEVEQHRELREYARLAAWELPMLHKLAQPFEPPSKSTPLRFRYTTYMGEQHPASRKVVLEFCPSDIPDLTPKQTTKLIKLAGPRYNPALERVKMSCESFETQAQNKRYLGDLVYKLLKAAKDESTDGFEDIPVDERHVKRKAYHQFPERWKVTPQRRKELDERRVKELEEEARRRNSGELVDGVGVIHNALERLGMREMVEERARGRVGAGPGAGAKAVRGKGAPGAKSPLFK